MSKHEYTMTDFHAEMRRRKVYERSDWRARKTQRKFEIVPCSVHPLHTVRVTASGGRIGCSMCEDQISDLVSPR